MEESTVPVSEGLDDFQKDLISRLSDRVIGQERAIRRLVRATSISRAKLSDPEKPSGIFFFVGPPGVGKTYLAEVFAEELIGTSSLEFGSPLIKISCETLSEKHTAAFLTGSPPGYVGYDNKSPFEEVGLFERKKLIRKYEAILDKWLEEMRKRLEDEYPDIDPSHVNHILSQADGAVQELLNDLWRRIPDTLAMRSVILFDEFEKAHPSVQKTLLNILDRGKLRLLNGKEIDFRNSFIILTSNIGTEKIRTILDGKSLGFHLPHTEDVSGMGNDIYQMVQKELKNPRNLDPALYRRIGSQGIIVFGPLSEDDYAKIIDIEIAKLQAQLNETSRANGTASLIISVTDEFKGFLLAQADNPAEGASQIASIINKWMRDPLATRITAGSLRRGDSILFALKDGKLEILRTSVKDGERPPVDFEQEQDDDSDLIIYMNEELKKFEEGMNNAMRYLLRGANSSSGPSRHSISEASPHRPAPKAAGPHPRSDASPTDSKPVSGGEPIAIAWRRLQGAYQLAIRDKHLANLQWAAAVLAVVFLFRKSIK